MESDIIELTREHWMPLFDQFNLTIAFENHAHNYKRTKLMKYGNPTYDNTGTLYMGDGCWGVKPQPERIISDSISHFDHDLVFDSFQQKNYVLSVSLSRKNISLSAIGDDWNVFDSVIIDVV